ncbi:MAG: ABC transporter ATP-binding protein [Clostridiales bacterium]|nr:ABC transporter ATP-binding protein [Clostridiales bacterium]
MPKTVLEIKNLTKHFGKRTAVNNLSLVVREGEIFGFLGANGAGKSTTIKMLTGLTTISSGDAFVCGNSVKYKFEKAMEKVGTIVEVPEFYNYLTGYQNLKYLARLSNVKDKHKIDMVVETVGLSNRIREKVSKYSLGMKQRLGVAQALLNDPKLLILDEPTNGLDANGIREFRLMLKDLAHKHNIAILISSHILSEMQNLCDTIGIIDNGVLLETNSMSSIRQNISEDGSQYIKCNAPNFAGKLIQEEFKLDVKICKNKVLFTTDEDTIAKIIIFLTQKKVMVFGAGEVDASLEDIFLTVINDGKSGTGIN